MKRATPAALMSRTEKLSIDFDGLTINFDCAPRRFNPDLEQEVRSAETTSSGLSILISALVTGWDLMESDEPDAQPYPLTVAALSQLPVEFLSKLAEEITRAMGPNSPSTTTSVST